MIQPPIVIRRSDALGILPSFRRALSVRMAMLRA